MRTTSILLTMVLALALLPSAVAGAHPDDDSQDPDEIETSDNLEFVEHHWFPQGSDMYFQRREGRQRFDGRVIDATKVCCSPVATAAPTPRSGRCTSST